MRGGGGTPEKAGSESGRDGVEALDDGRGLSSDLSDGAGDAGGVGGRSASQSSVPQGAVRRRRSHRKPSSGSGGGGGRSSSGSPGTAKAPAPTPQRWMLRGNSSTPPAGSRQETRAENQRVSEKTACRRDNPKRRRNQPGRAHGGGDGAGNASQ